MRKEDTKTKAHKISQRIKDFAGLISAILAIGTALIGAGHWIVKEVSASTDNRIDALEAKIEANQDENKLAITRLELMTLMETNPENVVEIERVAKTYFVDLKGDLYLTSVYSSWAKKYGGDTSFVVYH